MSDHDRALEKAAYALAEAEGFTREAVGRHDLEDFKAYSAAVIETWLDSLLEGLPPSATLAALGTHRSALEDIKQGRRKSGTDAALKDAIGAFLRSLRTGLEGGTE